MELIRLKSGPMSSQWSFVGAKNGYTFYRSRSGKLFAKHADGTWYKVSHKSPEAQHGQ